MSLNLKFHLIYQILNFEENESLQNPHFVHIWTMTWDLCLFGAGKACKADMAVEASYVQLRFS